MAIGNAYQLNGQVRATDGEAREHQAALLAKRITEIPSILQIKVDANGRSDNQPVYVGFAEKDNPTSDIEWIIWKITYDSYNDFSYKQSAFGSWDDRASLTYS